jgi:hypothetical protein
MTLFPSFLFGLHNTGLKERRHFVAPNNPANPWPIQGYIHGWYAFLETSVFHPALLAILLSLSTF